MSQCQAGRRRLPARRRQFSGFGALDFRALQPQLLLLQLARGRVLGLAHVSGGQNAHARTAAAPALARCVRAHNACNTRPPLADSIATRTLRPRTIFMELPQRTERVA